MDMVLAELARWPVEHMAVMGSSLGGFYATVVAERCACRAVLLNPAINPARDLAGYIGDLTSFHDPDDHFYFRPEYVTQLRLMTPRAITRPERYLAVIAKGDEVLDWREMSARYAGAAMELLDGGDHALTDFESQLPRIARFLGLRD
jgi:predicted esterase YcpF (UPF0227 family)